MYCFSYFKTDSEALHLMLSSDGYVWNELNGGNAILSGTVNTKTLRDPFIIEDHNHTFHLLATDGWASPFIIHAESSDLIHWSDQEALPVMVEMSGAKNAWAPECIYVEERNYYLIFWASTIHPVKSGAKWDHRIWCTSTTDFKNFTPSRMFFNPGFSCIDSTIIRFKDRYLMVFKDERGEFKKGTDFKALRSCFSDSVMGPYSEISDIFTPALVEGPTLFIKDNTLELLCDFYGDAHYGAYESTDGKNWVETSSKLSVQGHPRHGSVFTIQESVAHQLITHFGSHQSHHDHF